MKQNIVRLTLILFFLVTFPNMALADDGEKGLQKEDNGYQIELVFTTGQAQTGSNELAIKLHDLAGNPLSDATVKVSVASPESAYMDSIAGMTDYGEDGITEHGEDNMTAHSEDGMADHGEDALGDHTETAASEAGSAETDHSGANVEEHSQLEAGGHGGHGEENVAVILTNRPQTGEYTGRVEFSDTGTWLVKVNLEVAGQVKEADFVVEVGQNASKLLVLNGFLGINALIVTTAAITKRKFAPKPGKGKVSPDVEV
jgi:hypothetical protein